MTIHDTIAHVTALMEKATPGTAEKYHIQRSAGRKSVMVRFGKDPNICEMVMHTLGRSDARRDENADLIVAMRNAMPELLAYIQRLEAVVAASRPLLAHIDALEAELPLHYHSCSGSCIDDFCAKCRGEDVVKRHIDENASLYDRSIALTEVVADAISKLDSK